MAGGQAIQFAHPVVENILAILENLSLRIDLSKPGTADILPLLIIGLTNKHKIIARHSVKTLATLSRPDCNHQACLTILPDLVPNLVRLLSIEKMTHLDIQLSAIETLKNLALYDADCRAVLVREPACIRRTVGCALSGRAHSTEPHQLHPGGISLALRPISAKPC